MRRDYDYPETEHPGLCEYDFNEQSYMGNNNGNYSGGYNNNRGNNNNGNRNGNYGNSGNGGNNNQSRKKHSGAKVVNITKGKNKGAWGISAWNYSRAKGMVSLLITPYDKTHESTSQHGRKWLNMMVKAFFKNTGQTVLFSAMVDPATRKATIKDMGWIVNPNAPNGGYCGTFTRN